MVLAAGLGQRMRPITDTLPKPLIEIGGKPMLDHALDRLAEAGIVHAVVNVHYLADCIEAHLGQRTARAALPRISISDEREQLLETGGGVKKALKLLGRAPFIHVNSDSLWIEEGHSNLSDLIDRWDPDRMDILLLLAHRARSLGFDGAGDFEIEIDGRLRRRGSAPEATLVYAGVAIIKPTLFEDSPAGSFSLNLQFDRAIEAGTLHGHVLRGTWLHVGTPEAIAPANARLAASAG
jgi:MurNAc alpha-1-phosphate uridylyltransferase